VTQTYVVPCLTSAAEDDRLRKRMRHESRCWVKVGAGFLALGPLAVVVDAIVSSAWLLMATGLLLAAVSVVLLWRLCQPVAVLFGTSAALCAALTVGLMLPVRYGWA
jgi:hypothetical protein